MNPVRSIFIDSHLPYVRALTIATRVQGTGDPLLVMNGMSRPLRS